MSESDYDLVAFTVCEVLVDDSDGNCVIISPRLVSKVSIRFPSSFIRCITCSPAAENFSSICRKIVLTWREEREREKDVIILNHIPQSKAKQVTYVVKPLASFRSAVNGELAMFVPLV